MADFTDITSYYPSATPTQDAPLPGLGGEGYVPPTPTPEIASPGAFDKLRDTGISTPLMSFLPSPSPVADFSGIDFSQPSSSLAPFLTFKDDGTQRLDVMGKNFTSLAPKQQEEVAQRFRSEAPAGQEAKPLWQQEWAWTAGLSMAALFYQMYQDRENRKTQMELYNQQLKIREQERKDEYDQAVSLAKLQSQLAIAGASANKGGAVVRGGFN